MCCRFSSVSFFSLIDLLTSNRGSYPSRREDNRGGKASYNGRFVHRSQEKVNMKLIVFLWVCHDEQLEEEQPQSARN